MACVAITFSPFIVAGGFVATHEAERYPALLTHFCDSLARGHAYPRWMPGLAGGYGYPTFVFYQPLVFFAAAAIHLLFGVTLGFALVAAVASFFAAACAAWISVARMLAPAQPSWIIPAVFALTPGLYLNLYVRGDLSEFAATNVAVLTLWSFVWLCRRLAENRGVTLPVLFLGASLAAVVCAHPMTGAVTWAMILALTLATLVGQARERGLVHAGCVGCAFVLGAVLSAPYWEPFVRLGPLVSLDRALSGYYDPTVHLVHPLQLLSRTWDFGGSVPGAGDAMSFQLGLPHVVAAAAGFVALRRVPLIWGAGLCYGALVIAMLPVAAFLWQAGSPLHAFQFPWRLLSVVAVLQPLFVTGIMVNRWETTPGRMSAGAIAVLVVMLAWYAPMIRSNPDVSAVPFQTLERALEQRFAIARQRFDFYALQNEFLPKDVTSPPTTPRGAAAIMECDAGGRVVLDATSFDDDIRARLTTDRPCTLVIRQFWFPGWEIIIDGRVVTRDMLAANRRPDGLIRLVIDEPGEHVIRATYTGPPGGDARVACMLAAGAVILALLRRIDRGRGSTAASSVRREHGVV